jgi:2-amino-4-hydroxy-6-hydroxymethyldihydropteridine diphosphokinase
MRVIIALGSNLGNRLQNLCNAINLMKSLISLRNVTISNIYSSKALTKNSSIKCFDYFNAALVCECYQSPYELLRGLQHIEKQIGRKPAQEVWLDRVIDLDILFFGHNMINSTELTIPHTEILQRDFVIEPVCEIIPDYFHPVEQKFLFELKKNETIQYVTNKFLL